MIHAHGGVERKVNKMEENQNVDIITSNEEVIVEGENIEFAVVEDENAVHVLPVVDGEVVDTPVVEIIPAEELTDDEEPAAENKDLTSTTLTGVVTATKLNVRELPNKDAKVVAVLNKGDIVVIDTDEEVSYEEFFKIVTADGLDCYCMKKFIELN